MTEQPVVLAALYTAYLHSICYAYQSIIYIIHRGFITLISIHKNPGVDDF